MKDLSIDGAALRYRYEYELPMCQDGSRDAAGGCLLEISTLDDRVCFSYNGKLIGDIQSERRAQMVRDFKRRGDPVLARLSDDGSTVRLFFFRDYRRTNDWREQRVVALVPAKTPAANKTLKNASPGAELEYGDDGPCYSFLDVRLDDVVIGRLPESEAKSYPYLIYLERVESQGALLVPYVRLYLGHKKEAPL